MNYRISSSISSGFDDSNLHTCYNLLYCKESSLLKVVKRLAFRNLSI